MGDSKRSGDDHKTKAELLTEIEELRRKVREEETQARGAKSDEPTLTADISRRDALKIAWVAPVILSVPLGTIAGARRAQAGTTMPPTMIPTTSQPTKAPTAAPTNSPTSEPTSSPTVSDATLEPPTQTPTVMQPTLAPTAFPSVRAVPAVSGAGVAAAAAVLFGIGAKKLHDKVSAEPDGPSADDDSEDGDDSN